MFLIKSAFIVGSPHSAHILSYNFSSPVLQAPCKCITRRTPVSAHSHSKSLRALNVAYVGIGIQPNAQACLITLTPSCAGLALVNFFACVVRNAVSCFVVALRRPLQLDFGS